MSARLLDRSPRDAVNQRTDRDRMSKAESLAHTNVMPFVAYAAPVVPAAAPAAAPADLPVYGPPDQTLEQRLQVCNNKLALVANSRRRLIEMLERDAREQREFMSVIRRQKLN